MFWAKPYYLPSHDNPGNGNRGHVKKINADDLQKTFLTRPHREAPYAHETQNSGWKPCPHVQFFLAGTSKAYKQVQMQL